ncbi:MAG: hypothetical protein GXP55_10635 [Deltaproteobacteria bacterium]|nr:hypothetical protein [Deltaproteobacteria bacterium]
MDMRIQQETPPLSAVENAKELLLSGIAWAAMMAMQKVWRPDQMQWMNRLYCDAQIPELVEHVRSVIAARVDAWLDERAARECS